MIINHEEILNILSTAKNPTTEQINEILEKAKRKEQLTLIEAARLLEVENKDTLQNIYEIAGKIKKEIYGNRIVMFAPLYVSNFCVNNCTYCGYRRDNRFERRKLTQAEIADEIRVMEKMGHKRIALEVGEDPKNSDINFVLETINTIYNTFESKGAIRRINVNIAATTVEEYKMLNEAQIGTYILFQETYNKEDFNRVHPKSLKGNYDYHLEAFDRAMEAGIEDVGGGVLFGLSEYKYEVIAMLMHNLHLEKKFGVGFHTMSVPRLKKAEGVDLKDYPFMINDDEFKKIVTILRLAVPYVGIILSTRETEEMRSLLLKYGVSQISAGSITGVGGYNEESTSSEETAQFEVSDERSLLDVTKSLIKDGYIPSFCTACYRSGRTGDRFMALAKSGQIGNVCEPNALMTLLEFIHDYGDDELKELGLEYIDIEANKLKHSKVKELTLDRIEKIKKGERDLFV